MLTSIRNLLSLVDGFSYDLNWSLLYHFVDSFESEYHISTISYLFKSRNEVYHHLILVDRYTHKVSNTSNLFPKLTCLLYLRLQNALHSLEYQDGTLSRNCEAMSSTNTLNNCLYSQTTEV